MTDYKYLGFVPKYVATAWGVADNVYSKARSYTPGFADPYVKTAEDNFAKFSAPVVTKVQDLGDRVLHTFDNQVRLIRFPGALLASHTWRFLQVCSPPG